MTNKDDFFDMEPLTSPIRASKPKRRSWKGSNKVKTDARTVKALISQIAELRKQVSRLETENRTLRTALGLVGNTDD